MATLCSPPPVPKAPSCHAEGLTQCGAAHDWWVYEPSSVLCPISDFPICLLEYPPFKFMLTERNKIKFKLIDGKHLALRMVVEKKLSVCDRPLTAPDYENVEHFIKTLGLDWPLTRVYHLRTLMTLQSTKQEEKVLVADELKWHTDAAQAQLASLVRVKMERFIAWQHMFAMEDRLESSVASCQSFPSSPAVVPGIDFPKLVDKLDSPYFDRQHSGGNDATSETTLGSSRMSLSSGNLHSAGQPEFVFPAQEEAEEHLVQQHAARFDRRLPPSPRLEAMGPESIAHFLHESESNHAEWAQKARNAEVFTPKTRAKLDFLASNADDVTPARPDPCALFAGSPEKHAVPHLPFTFPEPSSKMQPLGWPLPKPIAQSDTVVPMCRRSGATSLGAIGDGFTRSTTSLRQAISDAGLPPHPHHDKAWKTRPFQSDFDQHPSRDQLPSGDGEGLQWTHL